MFHDKSWNPEQVLPLIAPPNRQVWRKAMEIASIVALAGVEIIDGLLV
jgi:predicted nuclease with RNAse H fold